MYITNNSSTNFFIPIYDLSSNLKNLIFPKTVTPHYWRHNARKVALMPEMWCRPDLFNLDNFCVFRNQWWQKCVFAIKTSAMLRVDAFGAFVVLLPNMLYFGGQKCQNLPSTNHPSSKQISILILNLVDIC